MARPNILPRSLLAAFTLIGMAAWSPASHACSSEPIMSSLCIMTVNPAGRFQSFNNTYVLAAGQVMSISQNSALFSLIGTTFGGDGQTTFVLPDLRGKVVVGYDPRDGNRAVGVTGGATAVNLSVAQLPPHAVPLTNVPVSLSGVHATTTLSGLTATANLGGVVITGAATGLQLRAVSGGSGQSSPAGNYLGKAPSSASSIYSNATPNATMHAGSIGGDLSLTVAANTNAPVTGSATTTLDGQPTITGTSGVVGSGAAVPVMPPYLVLPYYIALNGIYPSSD
jgi:microcystin-dependent protein